MPNIKIKPKIVLPAEHSNMTIAHYIDPLQVSYLDAFENYIGRIQKCKVVCNLDTALNNTSADAKRRVSNNNILEIDDELASSKKEFITAYKGKSKELLAFAKNIVIHLMPSVSMWWKLKSLINYDDKKLLGVLLKFGSDISEHSIYITVKNKKQFLVEYITNVNDSSYKDCILVALTTLKTFKDVEINLEDGKGEPGCFEEPYFRKDLIKYSKRQLKKKTVKNNTIVNEQSELGLSTTSYLKGEK